MTRRTTSDTSVRISPATKRAGAHKRRGTSLIEFTLIMPFLLLVATGMVSFGLALHNDLVLTNAVNLGAQTVSFSRGQTTDPCATAYSAISNAAPALASSLTLTYNINGTNYTSNTCTAGTANMVQGGTIQITGKYPYTLSIVGDVFPSHSLAAQVSEYIQ